MTDLALPGFEATPAVPAVRLRYQLAIAERLSRAGVSQQRSWDAYGDVFAPAWDDVADDGNDCIGVVCAFIEYVCGEPLEANARARVVRGVRMFGKAMLFGINEALSRVEPDEDYFRYAMAVAKTANYRHRTNGGN